MRSRLAIEWLTCALCGLQWPACENASPGVPRDTRCQRCLVSEVNKLRRKVLVVCLPWRVQQELAETERLDA